MELVQAKSHKQTEAHAWQIEHPLSHHKPYGEQEVGGRQEGEDHQTQSQGQAPPLHLDGSPGKQGQGNKGHQSEYIPGVIQRIDRWDCDHGDLCT